MPNYLIITGVVVGLLCAAMVVIWRQRYRDLFPVLLVVGILVLAVAVTVQQVDQYRHQPPENAAVPQLTQSEPPALSGSSAAPPAVIVVPPAGMRGTTGAAAPNPHAGGLR